MGKNKNDDVDLQAILTQIVDQFDDLSRFNYGQLEMNKLLMEKLNVLEKKIEELEKKTEQLDKGVKAAKELAICG